MMYSKLSSNADLSEAYSIIRLKIKADNFFDVLLTVYLSIFILVINQLDARNFILQQVYFVPLHVSSTMCSSSGGQKLYYTASGIITPICVMMPDAV